MKWIALICLISTAVPISSWLRRNAQEAPKFWMLMGFLPFILHFFHLYMATAFYDNWPGYLMTTKLSPDETESTLGAWPGFVNGMEFSALDVLALALYFSIPKPPARIPFLFPMALYFLVVLLSVLQAGEPKATLFYSWQLARMFLIYATVARACDDPRTVAAILKGMSIGLILEAGVTIWQQFGLGLFQTPGTLSHQNLLGIMSEFIIFPVFFRLLSGRSGWFSIAVVLSGCIVTILTLSRATIGLAAFGFAIVFAISALHQWTSRKAVFLLIGLATFAVVAPPTLSLIGQRTDLGLDLSNFERTLLSTEAETIISEHPLGVGANQYVVIANSGYRQQAGEYRRQVGLGSTSYYAIVHNVYLLVAAETGYPGLITFVFLLICSLTVAFRCGWRNRGDQRGELLLGLGVALLVVYVHCFYEWVFLVFEPQYMFALELGLVANLAQQLGYWRSSQISPSQYAVGTAQVRSRGSGLANNARS